MKHLTLAFLFLIWKTTFGTSDFAILKSASKSPTFNGKVLSVGSKISEEGFLETSDGNAQIQFVDKDTFLNLLPNTKIKIFAPAPNVEKYYEFVKGQCRWIVNEKAKKKWILIKSSNAIAGVRGTDFYITYNELLGETEIVVFEGSVEFSNEKNVKNTELITLGQWGGIGGRFGSKISSILNLPPNVLSHFKNISEI